MPGNGVHPPDPPDAPDAAATRRRRAGPEQHGSLLSMIALFVLLLAVFTFASTAYFMAITVSRHSPVRSQRDSTLPRNETLHPGGNARDVAPEASARTSERTSEASARSARTSERSDGAQRIAKTRFSNTDRVVFVAGLEGTGHHLIGEAFATAVKGAASPAEDSTTLRCELYQRGQHHQAKAQGQRQPDNGLFPVPRESEQFLRKRDKVLNLLKTLTKTQRAQGLVEGARVQAVSPGSSQVRLHVMNTVNGGGQRIKLCRSGMISYPNFRAGSPDVVLLAQLAEEAGVDLRIIVLTRPADQMLASTTRRFAKQDAEPYKKNGEVMLEAAALLSAQLLHLDPAFITCLPYDTAVYGSDAASDSALHAVDSFLLGPPSKRDRGGWSFSGAMKRTFASARKKGQKETEPVAAEYQSLLKEAHAANDRIVAQCPRPAWSASRGPVAESGATSTNAVILSRSNLSNPVGALSDVRATSGEGRRRDARRWRSYRQAPPGRVMDGDNYDGGQSKKKGHVGLAEDYVSLSTTAHPDRGEQPSAGERTVIWHPTFEGFSNLFQTFSCAVWLAANTNRTLLLAPSNPQHANLSPDYLLYVDTLVELPRSLSDTTIKHVSSSYEPAHAVAIQCGCQTGGKMKFDVPGSNRSGWPHQQLHCFNLAKHPKRNCRYSKRVWSSLKHEDSMSKHVEIMSLHLNACNSRIPFLSKGSMRHATQEALAQLRLHGSGMEGEEGGGGGARRPVWTIHLRRGDRCSRHHSGACGDVMEWLTPLMSLRDKETASDKSPVVYVATDETRKSDLEKIRRAGVVLYSDLKRSSLNNPVPGALRIFLTELDILIHSDQFFYPWGTTSNVPMLVNNARVALGLTCGQTIDRDGTLRKGEIKRNW